MKDLCPCIIVLLLYKVHTEETTKRIGNWFLEGESRVTQLQNSSDRHVMFKLLTQQEGLSVEGQLPTFQPLWGVHCVVRSKLNTQDYIVRGPVWREEGARAGGVPK